MLRFVQAAGPFIFVEALLALVILTLVLLNLVRLLSRDSSRSVPLQQSIDAVLFWGSITAVLGVFAQWRGLFRAANAIAEMGIVNPQAVVYGISESLSTVVFGMFVFVVSIFLWFGLRVGLHFRAAR